MEYLRSNAVIFKKGSLLTGMNYRCGLYLLKKIEVKNIKAFQNEETSTRVCEFRGNCP